MTVAPDIHTHAISQTINQDILVQPHAFDQMKAVVSSKTICDNTTSKQDYKTVRQVLLIP